jgi:hypothetical protein
MGRSDGSCFCVADFDLALDYLSKNHATPKPRMPAVTSTANHRCRYHDGRRCHGRCYDNRARCDYDWPVRATHPVRIAVKARTTSALGTGAVDADE